MNYDVLFQKAREVASSRMQSGAQVFPDDTVCVIYTQTGRIYVGLNRRDRVGGKIMQIHAEAEGIRNMQAGSEAIIRGLLLMSIADGTPLLPCDHCLRCILALNKENEKCEILMHDRAVAISQLSQFSELQGNLPKVSGSAGSEDAAHPAPAVPKASSADYLRDRVNSLLNAADEIAPAEPEEEEESFSVKKLFGGLFGKK